MPISGEERLGKSTFRRTYIKNLKVDYMFMCSSTTTVLVEVDLLYCRLTSCKFPHNHQVNTFGDFFL
ncbi:hypothetical protein HanRHA438_Chr05g0247161 [Helianthus annuus]|nr:hypothetical protein HanRHA438_Chr05g0247161 [Helianthus annuus]